MYYYPYAAPVPSTVVWAGEAVGVALMVAALVSATFLVVLAWHATHRRVVRRVPMTSVVPGRTQLPRVAA